MAIPFANQATQQTARKVPSLRVASKWGVCVVTLLGIVDSAAAMTRCAKRLVREWQRAAAPAIG